MKLIDSSGWLQFFTDGPLADAYRDHLGRDGSCPRCTVVTSDEDFERLPGVHAPVAELHLQRPGPLLVPDTREARRLVPAGRKTGL